MPRVYLIGGQEREMFTSGDLAKALERQTQTILKWERQGIIPQTPFRSKTGRRLYAEEQIMAISSTVDKYKLRQGMSIPQEFIDEVHNKFDEVTSQII